MDCVICHKREATIGYCEQCEGEIANDINVRIEQLEAALVDKTTDCVMLEAVLRDMLAVYSPTTFPATYHRAEQVLADTQPKPVECNHPTKKEE